MRRNISPWIALAAFAAVGCDGSAPIASDAEARRALVASLEAWKAGRPAGSLLGEKPSIEAVDFEWKAGKALKEFAIGDPSPGQGTRTFAATLTLGGEPAPRPVRYMVLGVDPVRIYRDEDFNRAMNMEDAPVAKTRRR